ncbi:MAG: iron-containing alcohol dehydrogenase [Propionibacteriaceae bacterium]|jgi:glycerol-1-phosphate dehydrogenase [NAD(P)+]|nr:iron-containing alcohol dehydrogenase [Propionibacteriaceae bacterium]
MTDRLEGSPSVPTERLIEFDPGDLPGFYQAVSQVSGRDRALSMSQIRLGPDALDDLVELVEAGGRTQSVAVVMDDVAMSRGGLDLKPEVVRRLARAGLGPRPLILSDPHGLHTTAQQVAELTRRLRPGDVVVSVGSGTVTDISKHAVHTFEQSNPGLSLRHVAVATANSVGAYCSQLAVVTINGVKRTLPSRLPDCLILDTQILADTPRPYALGGVGDGAVGWCSLGDYRLASWCGLGRWEPLSPLVFLPGLQAFLDQDPSFTEGGLATAEAMARNLSAAGFVMSFAGESAPASGLEHVTSHMLDMAADHHGRPIGNHGEQCGLATALVLLVYRHLLTEFDPSQIRPADLAVDRVAAERQVRQVFDPIDPSGQMSQECWSDFSAKCQAWEDNRDQVWAVLQDWPARVRELSGLVADPERYIAALAATGHPLSFRDVPPGLPDDQVRWAFSHARLMRRRLSVADFLGFLGQWDDRLVDRILGQFEELCQRHST